MKSRAVCPHRLFVFLLTSLWLEQPARAGAISNNILTNLWYPDGYVYAVAEANGVIYIGGEFHYVGPETGQSAFLDPITGARDDSYPKADGPINIAIPDGAGGMFIGGDFSMVGGMSRYGIAHLLADKTVDPNWSPTISPGSVSALALAGNTLYLAGGFFSIAGSPRNGLGAVDASTGAVTSWNPNSSFVAQIKALAVIGSNIYVAGTFASIGGQNRTNLAALDASGNALPFSPNPNGPPAALLVSGSTLYVGGQFTRIGGQNRTNLAAVNATTGNALSFPNDRPNGQVNSLALSGNTLYVGGFFNALGSNSRPGLGAIDTTTGNATSWNPGVGLVGNPTAGGMFSVAYSGSSVYVGGTFTFCGGQPRLRIAALDPSTGTAQSGFNPGANAVVRHVIPVGDRILTSGDFGSIGGAKRNNIAALDATTGAVSPWDASMEYYTAIHSIIASNTVLFVGGYYTNIGGQVRQGIAALNTTTGAATSWNPNPIVAPNSVNSIYTMLLSGDTLYIAGAFGPMGGALRTNAVALNTSTALATPWNPLPNSIVYALAKGNGVIYAGGTFKQIGGVQMTNLAALDPNTGAATAWNPRCASTVYALVADANALYVGGLFNRISGQNRTNFAALNHTTGDLLNFPNPAYDFSGGGVYSLALLGTNSLLIGGAAFNDIGGYAGGRIFELEIATGNRTSWDPGPERPGGTLGLGYVQVITVGADKVHVGGAFQGGFAAYGLAGLPPPLAPPPQLVMPAWTMSGFQFRLLGTDGQQYLIEATSDFVSWDFVDQVAPISGFADVTDPNASFYDWRFYRASGL